MEFIDSTGHVFSLQTYDDNPVLYKYKENDYIFWLKDNEVSVNNFYIKPIRFIINENEISFEEDENDHLTKPFDIEISIQSSVFKLIGPKYIQEKLEQKSNINESLLIDFNECKTILTLDDFYFDFYDNTQNLIVEDKGKKFYLFPFYVIGRSKFEGTYLSNIMIKTNSKTEEKKTVVYTKEQVFNKIIKETFSNINILKYNENSNNYEQWYTIKNEFNPELVEILYKNNNKILSTKFDPNDTNVPNQKFRINFWSDLPNDIYQIIFKLPKNKWLKNDDKYKFIGKIKYGCRECGSVLRINYDGDNSYPSNGYDKEYLIYDEYPNIESLNVNVKSLQEIADENIIEYDGKQYKLSISYNYDDDIPTTSYDMLEYSNGEWWVIMPGPGVVATYKNIMNNLIETVNRIYYDQFFPVYGGKFFTEKHKIINESGTQKEGETKFTRYEYDGIEYDFKSTEFSQYRNNEIFPRDENGGYSLELKPTQYVYNYAIRDIWFDVDNSIISQLTNDTIEIEEYVYKTKYTPITVGCTFIDECEPLIINGKNMGINLPKDILRAFYDSSFESLYPNEELLKQKMKELLMNYMSIKGECGNFKSVINSLKWFGWHNHLTISKLLKTDNDIFDQYVLDYFNVENDMKSTFKYFNTTNLISLTMNGNIETGEKYDQNYSNQLIGEGKPILEDLFKKNVEVVHDDISFYKPYYRFIFTEMALKLDALKYYWQTYFLPIHIKIKRASINYKVYANTIKLTSNPMILNTATPIFVTNDNIRVEFPSYNKLLFYKSQHYIDSNFNEFSNYDEKYSNEDLYLINENCIYIPIRIIDNNSLYSEYEYGDYIKTSYGEYMKVYKLFSSTLDNNTISLEETNDLKLATHFRASKYDKTIYAFKDIETNEILYNRYTKISSGLFKCKLILSCIKRTQSDTGKYIYIDGKYKYKDKFYNQFIDDFTLENNIYYENIKGNYVDYNGKCIYVDKKDRYDIESHILVENNDFIFYQTPENYFNNYIILPRYLTKKNNLSKMDWLNQEYRLSVFVNNKWFYYDFTINVPSIYLEFGKLKYQYYLKDEISMFKQLSNQNPLKFNSFMYQPNLVSIDTLFYDKDTDNVLTFIEKLADIKDKNDEDNDTTNRRMQEFYLRYYKNKIQIPYNKNYFNKIHLFELYDKSTNQQVEYNDNENEQFIQDLYDDLFENTNFKGIIEEAVQYDAYLMHDNPNIIEDGKIPYWYVVFISRYPIGNYNDDSLLELQKTEYVFDNYKIRYTGYNTQKFLINRMNVIPTNGLNHFNKNDLIVVGVYNNDFQFNIDLNTKWEISKIYDTKYNLNVYQNTNLAIINNNNMDGFYDPGYYNVRLNYTISGLDDYQYETKAIYKINNNIESIYYPEIKEYVVPKENYNINTVISDFKIMYENNNGERIYTTNILNPSMGYHPIGIKVVNANYFEEGSPALYMGLTRLSLFNPDHGRTAAGAETADERPFFGMSGYYIDGLPGYTNICFYDETGTSSSGYLCPQTDIALYDNGSPRPWCNPDGTPKWPAPNNRMWTRDPSIRLNYCINILNDDDTFNTNMFDNNCALSNWNGLENNRIIIDNFDESLYPNWRTEEYSSDNPMPNPGNKKFSPAVACAWRYHTTSTNQGDWFIPSVPNVLFMMFNFKKYSDIFLELTSHDEYKPYCKSDLLSGNGNTFFTSTPCPSYNNASLWDIHMFGVCHVFTKTATWESIPYIFINE